MKKPYTKWYLISLAVMWGLPWVSVKFAPADAGMAICLILFYVINPLYSVMIGYIAASGETDVWVLPCASANMFLFGTWIFFDMHEITFIVYALIYIVIGYGTMAVTKIMNRKREGTAE